MSLQAAFRHDSHKLRRMEFQVASHLRRHPLREVRREARHVEVVPPRLVLVPQKVVERIVAGADVLAPDLVPQRVLRLRTPELLELGIREPPGERVRDLQVQNANAAPLCAKENARQPKAGRASRTGGHSKRLRHCMPQALIRRRRGCFMKSRSPALGCGSVRSGSLM